MSFCPPSYYEDKIDGKSVEWSTSDMVVNKPEKTPLQEWLPYYFKKRQAMGVRIGLPPEIGSSILDWAKKYLRERESCQIN